jgi:hypothetical protein
MPELDYPDVSDPFYRLAPLKDATRWAWPFSSRGWQPVTIPPTGDMCQIKDVLETVHFWYRDDMSFLKNERRLFAETRVNGVVYRESMRVPDYIVHHGSAYVYELYGELTTLLGMRVAGDVK